MTGTHMHKLQGNELTQADTEPSANTIKTKSEIEIDTWKSGEYPRESLDNLSEFKLSRKALRELYRRTRTRRRHISPGDRHGPVTSSPASFPDLTLFASHGGPDLCDLRGYPHPSTEHRGPVAMNPSRSSRSRRTRSTNPASTALDSVTVTDKTRTSTPYSRAFDLHLTDHLIHPIHASQEPNLEGIMSALASRRASLSPSQFSENDFKIFRGKNFRAKDEFDVLTKVIPTIHGPSQFDQYCAGNTIFTNLEPLTNNTAVAPKPDIYYGAYPERLAPSIRKELACHIVPSTMEDKPMAPNFFMEAKGPDGSLAVAMRQARYDGAIGSRAIHSLQNYNQEEPVYDGTPYTFSSIYHGGTLQLYAHHVTAPAEGGRPEYHMSQLRTFAMTDSRETFVQGATAFRNARELARQYRDNFIQAANAKAKRDPVNHQSLNNTTDIRHAESPDDLTSPRPHTANEAQDVDSPDELAPSPSKGLREPSQESTATGYDPSASLATTLTTSLTPSTSIRIPSKRRRSSSLSEPRDEAPQSRTRGKGTRSLNA